MSSADRADAQGSTPKSTLTVVRAMLDGLLLRCPRCHQGHLFPRLFSYHMNQRCPRCGLVFEPDLGEMTGGMAINMVLTSILGTALAIYGGLFSNIPIFAIAVALTVGGLLFALWFHPHARGLWVGVLYGTGALLPPSGRSAQPPEPSISPDAVKRRAGAGR